MSLPKLDLYLGRVRNSKNRVIKKLFGTVSFLDKFAFRIELQAISGGHLRGL
jgi:hypothetical protein